VAPRSPAKERRKPVTDSSLWNFFHSTGGDPDLIDQDGLEEALGPRAKPDDDDAADGPGPDRTAFVRVRGDDWTDETRLYHALVRRLGGFVELTGEETEPGPSDGLVMSGGRGRIHMRYDTFSCRPPDRVVDRFRNDAGFHALCMHLRSLVRRGRFSMPDIYDAVAVARALGRDGMREEEP
jgi:hypothetical protein